MHAFLITQSTPEKRLDKADELIRERNVDSKNRFLLVKDPEKKSIGIEDTKELKRWMGQVSTKPRAALIGEAQLLTVPAQQSLLKTLEEPGGSAIVILTADSEMSLLPTVRSRCKIIRLKSKIENIKSKIENDNLFSDFPFDKRAGEKILWLYRELSEYAGKKMSPHQGSIGRETGIGFIEKLIEEINNQLLVNSYQGNQKEHQNQAKILDEAAKAYQRLKQNISPMLVLQEFVLRI